MGEGEYAVDNGWLVEVVNQHTCGTAASGYYGAHEPGCGTVPVARIKDLLSHEYDRFRYFHLWNDLRTGLDELTVTGQIDAEVQKFLLRFHLAAAAARCGQPDHGEENHDCPREALTNPTAAPVGEGCGEGGEGDG